MAQIDWQPSKAHGGPKAAPCEPLPHGGYVLGEELAARSTASIRAQYGAALSVLQNRFDL